SNAATGWARTDGSLTWSTMGPIAPLFTQITDPFKKVLIDSPGMVRVAPVDPSLAQQIASGNFGLTVNPLEGIPTTIYMIGSENTIAEAHGGFFRILQSVDG